MDLQGLWELTQVILGGAFFGLLALSRLAPRHPKLAWLQKLKLQDHRTEEQKRRARRNGNIMAGLQMIGLGLVTPIAYVAVTIVSWGDVTRPWFIGSVGIGLTLFFAGVVTIIRARTL